MRMAQHDRFDQCFVRDFGLFSSMIIFCTKSNWNIWMEINCSPLSIYPGMTKTHFFVDSFDNDDDEGRIYSSGLFSHVSSVVWSCTIFNFIFHVYSSFWSRGHFFRFSLINDYGILAQLLRVCVILDFVVSAKGRKMLRGKRNCGELVQCQLICKNLWAFCECVCVHFRSRQFCPAIEAPKRKIESEMCFLYAMRRYSSAIIWTTEWNRILQSSKLKLLFIL